jgi:hypothetical protein
MIHLEAPFDPILRVSPAPHYAARVQTRLRSRRFVKAGVDSPVDEHSEAPLGPPLQALLRVDALLRLSGDGPSS